MELNLELVPEDDAKVGLGNGLASPMGGKHQRDLSLSAKWANNKALALEYLKRQREAILWIESVLDRKLPTRDLFEALKSGIVLRELLAKLYPEPTQCRSPISRRYSLTMAPWKERENITVFLKHCKSMGMSDCFLFCTDDLYEGTNMVQVLFSVQHFMAFSQERSTHLFKPIVQESITFSNQELEMALSKIEQAGVDVNALLSSAPSSTSPSPAKPQFEEHDPIIAQESATENMQTNKADSVVIEATERSEYSIVKVDSSKVEAEPAQEASEPCAIVHDGEDGSKPDWDLDNHEDNNEDETIFYALTASASHGEDESIAIDEEECHDLEVEAQLPAFETDDDQEVDLTDDVTDAEISAFVADEMAESILLLEMMEEMLNLIELKHARQNSSAVAEICGSPVATDVHSVVRIQSAAVSELTDKHETYVGDSLAPTVADTHAAGGTETPANKFTRASRASKKVSKAAKTRREVSEEQLDAEAMSKCTCGSKCTVM